MQALKSVARVVMATVVRSIGHYLGRWMPFADATVILLRTADGAHCASNAIALLASALGAFNTGATILVAMFVGLVILNAAWAIDAFTGAWRLARMVHSGGRNKSKPATMTAPKHKFGKTKLARR